MFSEKAEYHIKLSENNCADYAILPGDPGRVEKIAQLLQNPQKLAQNREFTTYEGYIEDKKVLVTSTGIGGPSAAIAVEELSHIGVKNIIRVGTCGGMQPEITAGDLIIPTAAIRMDGTSKEYVPVEFPAVADLEITNALVTAAKGLNAPFHYGIVQSKDSFYGQHIPESMPASSELQEKWSAWKKAGALASEMECSAIFTVSSVRKINAGAILLAVWNQEGRSGINFDTTLEIKTAIEAVKILIHKNND